jgi:hypothetical protein
MPPNEEYEDRPNGDFTLSFDPSLQRDMVRRRTSNTPAPDRSQTPPAIEDQGQGGTPALAQPASEEALKEAYNTGLQHMHHRMRDEHHALMSRLREEELARARGLEEREKAALSALVAELEAHEYASPLGAPTCGAERDACSDCLQGLAREQGDTLTRCQSVVDAYVSCARAHTHAVLKTSVA